jgi:hypothetical protein
MSRTAETATTTALVFRFPMPVGMTNASGRSRHWRSVYEEKLKYWAILDMLVVTKLIQPPPAVPLPTVTVTSHMTLGGAMDDDNAVARHKWVLDWLRTRGYIATDRRTGLRWAAFPEQTVTRKANPQIELTVTPVSDNDSAP